MSHVLSRLLPSTRDVYLISNLSESLNGWRRSWAHAHEGGASDFMQTVRYAPGFWEVMATEIGQD